MTLKKNNPGCGCCVDCGIFEDNFDRADDTDLGSDWSVGSGSWEIANNKLLCTSTGEVLCQTSIRGTCPGNFIVEFDFNLDTPGDECRIIYYRPSNTLNYVRYLADGADGKIQINAVDGSTRVATTTINAGQTYRAMMCGWTNEVSTALVKAYIDGLEATTDGAITFPAVGQLAGISFIGSGTATFDNFRIRNARRSNGSCGEGCKDCRPFMWCGNRCNPGTYPEQIQVTIPDGTLSSNGQCTAGVCESVNGSVVVCDVLGQGGTDCRWESGQVAVCSAGIYVQVVITDTALEVRVGSTFGAGNALRFRNTISSPISCQFDGEQVFYDGKTGPFSTPSCSSSSGKYVVLDAL